MRYYRNSLRLQEHTKITGNTANVKAYKNREVTKHKKGTFGNSANTNLSV